MEKSKDRLPGYDPNSKLHTTMTMKTGKKPRRVAVKNPSFFLYKMAEEDGDLSKIGSYQTEVEICNAHSSALDEGIPEGRLVGFKGRPLEFKVTETRRRITVK